jgi:hypothetical protein
MDPHLSSQIISLFQEYEVNLHYLKKRQVEIVKKIRRIIDAGKAERIKKELSFSK